MPAVFPTLQLPKLSLKLITLLEIPSAIHTRLLSPPEA